MKKVLITILIIVIVAALLGDEFLFFKVRHSPEYALAITVKDIEVNGIEALGDHCTKELASDLRDVSDYSGSSFVDSLISFFTGKDDLMSIIQEHAAQIKWGVDDIEKGRNNSTAIITYDYKNGKITGKFDLDMIKEKGEWLISGFDFPKLEHIGW